VSKLFSTPHYVLIKPIRFLSSAVGATQLAQRGWRNAVGATRLAQNVKTLAFAVKNTTPFPFTFAMCFIDKHSKFLRIT